MGNNAPILYNEDKPLAHYEEARRLKEKVDSVLNTGQNISLAAFAVGVVCVFTAMSSAKPLLMALFSLFGLFFSVLGYMGCHIRRQMMSFISIPLGFAAAVVLAATRAPFAPLGAVLYIGAALMQTSAVMAIANFNMLKELPGFPFFDPGMDDLTFAALERHGAEEFIEGELSDERPERVRYLPEGPPSEDMDEIITEGIALSDDGKTLLSLFEKEAADAVEDVPDDLKDEVVMHLGHLDPNLPEHDSIPDNEEDKQPKSRYEQMINAQIKDRREISDEDLFG
ncbi:MAG: hypothetical protein J1F11_03110 [Oscillospiraceae bacterium]|nr:hypothetical protein [Oscillospiraceae bacterium]